MLLLVATALVCAAVIVVPILVIRHADKVAAREAAERRERLGSVLDDLDGAWIVIDSNGARPVGRGWERDS